MQNGRGWTLMRSWNIDAELSWLHALDAQYASVITSIADYHAN